MDRQIRIFAVVAVIATLLWGGYVLATIPQVAPTAQTAQVAPVPPTRDELLQLVNEERAKVGVAPLIADPMLEQSAQWKSDDMATYGYFGHQNHDGSRGVDIIPAFSGSLCSAGSENLSFNDDHTQVTGIGTISSWVSSKAHYDAMVSPKYTLTGFGIQHDSVVQHFCQQ